MSKVRLKRSGVVTLVGQRVAAGMNLLEDWAGHVEQVIQPDKGG